MSQAGDGNRGNRDRRNSFCGIGNKDWVYNLERSEIAKWSEKAALIVPTLQQCGIGTSGWNRHSSFVIFEVGGLLIIGVSAFTAHFSALTHLYRRRET